MSEDENVADMRRLAVEREGRINELADKVSALEYQLEHEHIACVKAEAEARSAQKSLMRLRKALRKTYLVAVEAGS